MKFSKKDLLRNLGLPENLRLENDESVMLEMMLGLESEEAEDISKRVFAEVKQLEGPEGNMIRARIVSEEPKMTEIGAEAMDEAILSGAFAIRLPAGIHKIVKDMEGEDDLAAEEKAVLKAMKAVAVRMEKMKNPGFPVTISAGLFLNAVVASGKKRELGRGMEMYLAQEGSMSDAAAPVSASMLQGLVEPSADEYGFATITLPSEVLREILAGECKPSERDAFANVAGVLLNGVESFVESKKAVVSRTECELVARERDDGNFVVQAVSLYNEEIGDAQVADFLVAFRMSAAMIGMGQFSSFSAVHKSVWGMRLRMDPEQAPKWKSTRDNGLDLTSEFQSAAKPAIGFKAEQAKPVVGKRKPFRRDIRKIALDPK